MRIGITGHRFLDAPDGWAWVEAQFASVLSDLSPPLLGVSCLAVGADQRFAARVDAGGGRILAILPFKDYRRTFDPQEVREYDRLLSRADAEVLDTPGTDEDAYLAAGRRVVELSDLVLAVWDAQPARGKGGTADVVDYAVQRGGALLHLNPITRTVRKFGGGNLFPSCPPPKARRVEGYNT